MPYRITYENSYSHSLTGQRNPTTETRATLESARARVIAMAGRQGLTVFRETSLGGDPYLNFGPTFGAHIEPA